MRTVTQFLLSTAIITIFFMVSPNVNVAKDPPKPKSPQKEVSSEQSTSRTERKPGTSTKSDSKAKSRRAIATLPGMTLKARGGKVYLVLDQSVKSLEAYVGKRLLGKLGSGKSFYINPWFEKASGKDLTFGYGRLRSKRFTQKEYMALLPDDRMRKNIAKSASKAIKTSPEIAASKHPPAMMSPKTAADLPDLNIKEIHQKNGDIVIVLENTGPMPVKDYHKARVELTYGGKKHSWPLSKVAPSSAFKKKGQIVFKTGIQPDKRGHAKARIGGLPSNAPSSAMAVAMMNPKTTLAKPNLDRSVPMQSTNPLNPVTGPSSSSGQPLVMGPTTSVDAPLSPGEKIQAALASDDPNQLMQGKGEVQPIQRNITTAQKITAGMSPDQLDPNYWDYVRREGVGGDPGDVGSSPGGPSEDPDQPPSAEDCPEGDPDCNTVSESMPPDTGPPLWTGPDYSEEVYFMQPGHIKVNSDFVITTGPHAAKAEVKVSPNTSPAVICQRVDIYVETSGWMDMVTMADCDDQSADFEIRIPAEALGEARDKAFELNPAAHYNVHFWIEFESKVSLRYCYFSSDDYSSNWEFNNFFDWSFEENWSIDCGGDDSVWVEHSVNVPVKVISQKHVP